MARVKKKKRKKKNEDEEETELNSRLNVPGVMRKHDLFLCAAAPQQKNSRCNGIHGLNRGIILDLDQEKLL